MRLLTDKKIEGSLVCPICRATMSANTERGASLVCDGQKKHCYDFSSRGYVNFTSSVHSGSGDSKQAVAARSAFLDGQYYRPVADAVCDILNKYFPDRQGTVIDAGCGEGYYSTIIAEQGYSVFGVDLSKFAIDSACKRINQKGIQNAFFSVASVFDIPFADKSADAVVNIFAPCVENEYFRLIKDGGVLVVVHAGRDHLLGLKQAIYDTARVNEEREDIPKSVKLLEEKRVSFNISINDNDTVKNLFAMTPYYWKTSKSDFEKLEKIDFLQTEIDMIISVFGK